MELAARSLVLYKGQPALVTVAARKLTIQLPDGSTLDVRPKDVALLHPGPLNNLDAAGRDPGKGEPLTAWELLSGTETTLPELSDLIFDAFTPATAWATWQLVDDGRIFSGTPAAVTVHDAETVAAIDARREAKAAEARAWDAFVARIEEGIPAGELDPATRDYLAEVERLALGQSESSRVLGALGHSQTPQSAHAFLLSTGYWPPSRNPYPARAGVAVQSPRLTVLPLPDEDRQDLTHLAAWAIDDEGSNDPDDAISYEDGCLWVHIADVAALVEPGSALDEEARGRGSNLYLAEGTVHMLPTDATDWLALGRQERSPALSFRLETDAEGAVTAAEIVPSWVRVTRLSYDEAESQLEESPLREMLPILRQHTAKRVENGAVELELPEVKVKIEESGQVAIKPLPPLESRALVREAMLMTGEAVGRYAQTHDIPMPYSAQSAPNGDPICLSTLSDMFAMRKQMQRSRQQTSPAPHSGLGLAVYVQATSPLRRYLDLVAHQQLHRHLAGEPLMTEAEIIHAIGATAAVVGSIRWAERQSIAHWTLVYLMQNEGWRGTGIVVEERARRTLVVIPDLAWETLINLSDLNLNSTVTLQARSVDLPHMSATFLPI